MAKMAASLGATCQPGKLQYDIFNGGNSKLAPEESRQASLGIRLEPNQSISYGADLWWVAIRKTFGSVVEEEAFGNVYKYPDLWMVYNDPVTGDKFLAYNSATTNLGNSYTSGIDFDVIARNRLASGNLTSSLRATYMIRDDFQLLPNGEYYATIADNHPSIGAVTFRWRGQLRNTYQQGNWAHTVNFNFQSGYRDYPAFVYGLDGSGNYDGNDREIRLKAKAYYTVDLQTAYRLNKSTVMSFGIRNLFDRDPPLSLRSSGAHMLGFDYRYYNPIGRTGQLRLSVSF
jgi:iron complex outermembrane receptor protein